MRTLIVLSHPDPASLTRAVADRIASDIRSADPAHEVEMADLSSEKFDPSFNAIDLAHFRENAPAAADVLAEQARLDRADALVMVFPVYWWAMPGQLKGWIDRVFVNGWAYDERPDGSIDKLLGRLRVHVVGVGGAGPDLYQRRGYDVAMRTQIEQGIFDYCGAPVIGADYLLPTDAPFPASALERAGEIGRGIAAATDSAAA